VLSARMDPEDLREVISAYQKSVALGRTGNGGCRSHGCRHAIYALRPPSCELHLRDALSNRFAPSNAWLSGASNLSRDQNRGEVNATPDKADAGATPRAVTNRPVRRRTQGGDLRHDPNTA
jgi:hypothetical protein